MRPRLSLSTFITSRGRTTVLAQLTFALLDKFGLTNDRDAPDSPTP